MIDGVEPFYQQIADSIVDAISDEWTSAKMEAAFFPDAIYYTGEYLRHDGLARGFPTRQSGERAFREIRSLFSVAGKPLWGRAIFNLDTTGAFEFNLNYDNCDENGYAIFDDEIEHKRNIERHERLTRR